MDDISQTLVSAIKLQQAGNLSEAERLCRDILRREPAHAAALEMLSFMAFQTGRANEAIEWISQALAVKPDNADYHNQLGAAYVIARDPDNAQLNFRAALRLNPYHAKAAFNLANVHRDLGRVDDAINGYEQAMHIDPRYGKAWLALADILNALGRTAEAAARYQQAVLLEPKHAEAQFRLGSLLYVLERFDDAIAALQSAVRLKPDYVDAYINLGCALLAGNQLADAYECFRRALVLRPDSFEAHNNMGSVLEAQQKHEEAVASHRRALELRPDSPEALNNLGLALQSQGRLEEAIATMRRAIEHNPQSADTRSNLGAMLQQQGQLDEAIDCLRRALEIDPQNAKVYNNMAGALDLKHHFDEALAYYDEAIRLKPAYAEARSHRALMFLRRGDFLTGWIDYEWRLKCKSYRGPEFREPLWDGSALAGRILLVHAEQGLGDTLQFIRYVPLVRQRCDHVRVLVPPALMPLLTVSGYQDLVAQGNNLPKFDTHVPLMSLPCVLRTTLETIPNRVPYLAPDPQQVEQWRRRLASFEGFKVGIAWQGNPKYMYDHFRSIQLPVFRRLAQVPGVRLFSLQKGDGTEQIAAAAEQVPLVDLGLERDHEIGAFMDTAAVMKSLDLVVAPNTATAHLAGALGMPVWVALPLASDWRWLINREDSPWYPSMRLFRQQTVGDWDDVFQRMAAELIQLAGNRSNS